MGQITKYMRMKHTALEVSVIVNQQGEGDGV